MRISWRWLGQFVDLEGHTPAAVAEGLTQRGLEVEGIETIPGGLEGVVVARIVGVEAHPDADKLRICTVDAGASPLRIVCGAPNAAVGMLTALALPGATLANGLTVREAKVRGVASPGMLCSSAELGVDEAGRGIMDLKLEATPASALPGTSLKQALLAVHALHDTIIEASVTPNRGDCLSHHGVAREVAAMLGRSLAPPLAALLHATPEDAGEMLDVQIEDPQGCPRYTAVVVKGVRVAPSPAWLRSAVEACGARSVSNVVDVTNYVAFELGHPQHAFDARAVRGGRLIVRRAHSGERLEAINHELYELEASDGSGIGDLVIADAVGPIAIAGVMGGAESEVGDETTSIVLECAQFDPSTVRRTAKRLGLHSESSHRFERGVDPNGVELATARAIALIARTQAELGQTIEVIQVTDRYPAPVEAAVVSLRVDRVNGLLGTDLSREALCGFLEPLGVKCAQDDSGGTLSARVPTYRFDLEREVDLIEEVARCFGVNNIEAVLPVGSLGYTHTLRSEPASDRPTPPPTITPWRALRAEARVRARLCERGLQEAVHYSFISPEMLAAMRFAEDDTRSRPLVLRNPMSTEQSVMRTSLVPGMLAAVGRNQTRQADSVRLFEIAGIFWREGDAPQEARALAVALWGRAGQHWSQPQGRELDAHDLRGVIEGLDDVMGEGLEIVPAEEARTPYLHPGVRAAIRCDGRNIGAFGEVHPQTLAALGVAGPVYVAELRLTGVLTAKARALRVAGLPRFPASGRDVALLVDASLPFETVAGVIADRRPPLLESWRLFDVYEGKGIEPGKRSVALAFVYRDPHADDPEKGRTLTDEEVNDAHGSLVRALLERLDATQR